MRSRRHESRAIPDLVRGQNFYHLDIDLRAILQSSDPIAKARWDSHLADFGAWVGSSVDEQAEYTDRFAPPVLETYERDGNMVNHIVHNPAWDAVAEEVYRRGIVGLNYGDDPAPFIITFAMGYLLSQADISLHCPVTMTGAVAYVLNQFAPVPVRARYLDELTRMDGAALTGGTWATELTGGSDMGATTTAAQPIAQTPGAFRLNGLKWFTSNANGGLALATARPVGETAPGTRGLGLYLVPTHLDDGAPNPMRIRRLKEKLGTRGVPTGEIDLIDTWACEVAPPPRGFKLMMDALAFSRVHNAMASVAVQRRAFLEALCYAARREAFGEVLLDFPMIQDQLLSILVAQEAGLTLSFEVARAFDRAYWLDVEDSENTARVWLRLVTALAKFQTAEHAVTATQRAIEILGGNGYTSDYATPRLLRDAQVLTVWEGPANIQALELMRVLDARFGGFALFRERIETTIAALPETFDAIAGPQLRAGVVGALSRITEAVNYLSRQPEAVPIHARKLLAYMADLLAVALLLESAITVFPTGDHRKIVVARLYLEQYLEPLTRPGIGPEQEWYRPYFDALVLHQPVTLTLQQRS